MSLNSLKGKKKMYVSYTDHAGPEIPVYLSIAWLYSRQIAIGNGGPATALESMGVKR